MPEPLTGGLVVDASAAIAVIRRESSAAFVQHKMAGRGRLIVPDPFWIEIANVLVRRYGATGDDVVEAIREIDELGIESVRVDRPLLFAAIDIQHRHRLSAYDATYLALTETRDAQLMTLDRRLAAAAGPRAVRLDGMRPPRLSEEAAAAYGSEPIDWARFGPYLARLRAEAREAPAR